MIESQFLVVAGAFLSTMILGVILIFIYIAKNKIDDLPESEECCLKDSSLKKEPYFGSDNNTNGTPPVLNADVKLGTEKRIYWILKKIESKTGKKLSKQELIEHFLVYHIIHVNEINQLIKVYDNRHNHFFPKSVHVSDLLN